MPQTSFAAKTASVLLDRETHARIEHLAEARHCWLHASAEKVERWLSSWGGDNASSAPACHQ